MKRGFVRCLWGVPSRAYARNSKVINWDIEFVKYNLFDQPFTTYIFGKDNYNFLVDKGFSNCKLVSDEVSLWHWKDIRHKRIDQYGHKLKTLEEASKDFDEFIFLDWDCMSLKPLPNDFWDKFYAKSAVQSHLRFYGNKQKWIQRKGAIWRDKNVNLRPCASFIYIRGKEIASTIYNRWLSDKAMSDEKTLALITDEMMGGWDINKYWNMFEPDYFMLFRNEVKRLCYNKNLLNQKNLLFMHVNKQITIPSIKETMGLKDEDRKKFITEKVCGIFDRFIKGIR